LNKKRVDQTYRLKMGDLLRIPPVRVAEKHEVEQAHIRRWSFRSFTRTMRWWW